MILSVGYKFPIINSSANTSAINSNRRLQYIPCMRNYQSDTYIQNNLSFKGGFLKTLLKLTVGETAEEIKGNVVGTALETMGGHMMGSSLPILLVEPISGTTTLVGGAMTWGLGKLMKFIGKEASDVAGQTSKIAANVSNDVAARSSRIAAKAVEVVEDVDLSYEATLKIPGVYDSFL